jgi:hypothetical protein
MLGSGAHHDYNVAYLNHMTERTTMGVGSIFLIVTLLLVLASIVVPAIQERRENGQT